MVMKREAVGLRPRSVSHTMLYLVLKLFPLHVKHDGLQC